MASVHEPRDLFGRLLGLPLIRVGQDVLAHQVTLHNGIPVVEQDGYLWRIVPHFDPDPVPTLYLEPIERC